MKHEMNKRILMKSENFVLRRYRFWFFGISVFLVGSYLYLEKRKTNKKLNLKSEMQKLKEKSEENNKTFEPSKFYFYNLSG